MKRSEKLKLFHKRHMTVVSPQSPFMIPSNKLAIPSKLSRMISRSQPRSPREPSPTKLSKIYSTTDSPKFILQLDKSEREKKTKKEVQLENLGKIDEIIDNFILKYDPYENLNTKIETFFEENTSCSKVIFWEEVESLQVLHSVRMKRSVDHSGNIVGFAYSSDEIVQIPVVKNHPSYCPPIDGQIVHPDSGVMCFKLRDSSDAIVGIVEIVLKMNERHLSEFHLQLVNSFVKKFKFFSSWLLEYPISENIEEEFQILLETDQFLNATQARLHSLFRAKTIEFWIYNKESDELSMFVKSETKIRRGKGGFVGAALKNQKMAHTNNVTKEPNYCPSIDGYESESVIVNPYDNKEDNCVYGIALRGNMRDEIFMHKDEVLLGKVIILVIKSFKNCVQYTEKKERENPSSVDIVKSLPEYQKPKRASSILSSLMQSLKSLLKCDRVIYFTVDNVAMEVRSMYITSNEVGVSYQFGNMHAGIAAETGETINCKDASKDPNADTMYDKSKNRTTKTILTVPVVTVDGKISAVIQAIDRCDGEPFTKSDSEIALIIGTICICLLENANLLIGSDSMKMNIRYSNELIQLLKNSKTLNEAGDKLCELLQKITKSQNCYFLLLDKVSRKVYEASKPETMIELSNGPVSECIKKNTQIISNSCKASFPKLSALGINKVCVTPLIDSPDSVIGVLMCTNSNAYTSLESTLMKSFADIFSFVVQRYREQMKNELGPFKRDIDSFVSYTERKEFKIPSHLKLKEDIAANFANIGFNMFESDPFSVECIIFNLFDRLGLMEPLKLNAEKVYEFSQVFDKSFLDVPFHNINYSIDTVQFLYFMINKARLEDIFTPVEIFGILSACFCFSMKHDGTNDAYNIASESIQYKIYGSNVTVKRALFNMQKVYTNHKMIDGMSEEEVERFCTVATTLIKALQANRKTEIIAKIDSIIKSSEVNLANEEHRMVVLELLFLCATYGWTCRPFEIASKWEDLRAKECFNLGALENQKEIVFSSPDNSPDLYCKPKSAIDILTSNVIPLFDTLAVIFSDLSVCSDAAKENLNLWNEEAKNIE